MNKFLSKEISWKRIWVASFFTSLIFFAMGFVTWYFFMYRPVAEHLAESQKLNAELKELYKSKGLIDNSVDIQK